MLGSALRAERRAFDRLFDALQNDPADALARFLDGVSGHAKARFRIETPVRLSQPEPALGDLSDSTPFAGDDAEDVLDEFLRLDISLAAHAPRVRILDLGAAFLQLLQTHVDAMENVERLELGAQIEVGAPVGVYQHAFTHFRITLHAFHCRLTNGEPQPLEASELRWVPPAELDQFPMGKVDREISKELVKGEA